MQKHKRILVLSLAVLAFYGLFGVLFVRNQVQASRTANEDANTAVATYQVPVEAARGEILDTNGTPLVKNRQGTSIVLYNVTFPADKATRNAILLSLIRTAESNGDTWIDDIPLMFDENGRIQYIADRDEDIAFMKSNKLLTLNAYASAQNCLDAFVLDYEMDSFSPAEQRKLASVYYNMARKEFSNYQPYVFAEDVSQQTVAYIMENNNYFSGVDTLVNAYREYTGDGTLASHILGVVGPISAEEYAAEQAKLTAALADETLSEEETISLKAKAYSYTDVYGKFGMEATMENALRGSNGTLDFYVDSDGNVTRDYSVLPENGNAVVLSIDKGLQEIAEKSLQERILAVTTQEAIDNGMYPAGSVIVENIHTGAILAMASYPDFSLTTYYDDYNALLEQPGKPLWNRAAQSVYSPGSTMKCAVAIAALEEGIVDEDDTFLCQGTYTYKDQQFACAKQTAHGWIHIKQALLYSCNIFFYQVAEKLGIEKIQEYASLLGLGSPTGIEINESVGILAGPEYRDTIGKDWQPGETLLAAIGQSDNSFSMLQLVNYVATIANGGTRYTPYLVEKILSSNYSEILFSHEPVVAAEIGVSQKTIDIVKEGMLLVATESSCKESFANLEHQVAAKTGTAEKTQLVDGKYVEGTDGFLITFGPYENAEIAVAIVVENAGSGASTAQVAADIYDYYFTSKKDIDNRQSENRLLG